MEALVNGGEPTDNVNGLNILGANLNRNLIDCDFNYMTVSDAPHFHLLSFRQLHCTYALTLTRGIYVYTYLITGIHLKVVNGMPYGPSFSEMKPLSCPTRTVTQRNVTLE